MECVVCENKNQKKKVWKGIYYIVSGGYLLDVGFRGGAGKRCQVRVDCYFLLYKHLHYFTLLQ